MYLHHVGFEKNTLRFGGGGCPDMWGHTGSGKHAFQVCEQVPLYVGHIVKGGSPRGWAPVTRVGTLPMQYGMVSNVMDGLLGFRRHPALQAVRLHRSFVGVP